MGFSRQEYWNGLPVPSPGDLPDPGIFPIHGSNLGLPHCNQMLYHLSYQGSPEKWYGCLLTHFSPVQLYATLWTVARQALLSLGILQARILEWVASSFSRASSLGPRSLLSPALASSFFTTSSTWKAQKNVIDEPISKAGAEMQMQGTNKWTQREK